jgi:hypothetical protein
MGVLDFLSAVVSRDRSIFSFITSLLSPLLRPERSICRAVCKTTLYVGQSLILCFFICHLEFSRNVCDIGYLFNDILCISFVVGPRLRLRILVFQPECSWKVSGLVYRYLYRHPLFGL